MKDPADKSAIPKEHRFVISNIANQNLAVFSQNKVVEDGTEHSSRKVYLEGHVVQKGECRPLGDDRYMQLKRQTILKASQPVRQVKQLDRIVQNYKPVSDHKHNLEFEQKKKAEGKKAREDKDKVLDMLFSAFEKHQYYNIKDLEKITRQPVPYLKEILKEICNYNAKNPHKNMWELKPEYRHYKDQEAKQWLLRESLVVHLTLKSYVIEDKNMYTASFDIAFWSHRSSKTWQILSYGPPFVLTFKKAQQLEVVCCQPYKQE